MASRRTRRPRRGPQARGERTRRRILDAVLELLALEGPSAVTYRAVAERAGVTQGVMTYHFASRRELLSAAFRLHLARLRESAAAFPVDAGRDLPIDAKARLVFRFLKSMVVEQRTRHLAEYELTLELARDPALRAELAPETDLTHGFARKLLEAGGSRHADADATIVSALMDGLALAWLARPDDPAFERRARAAVRRMVERVFA